MRKFQERSIKADGLEFYLIEEGDGPLVMCVHGTMDTSRSYRALLPALANEGFHAVAFNLRGYWPSAPSALGQYDLMSAVEDTKRIIESLGYGESHIIGHGFGAEVALTLANTYPYKIGSIVAISGLYGSQAKEFSREDPQESKLSRYLMEFQKKDADDIFRSNDFERLKRLRSLWSPGWKGQRKELDHIIRTFRKPGVVESAISFELNDLLDWRRWNSQEDQYVGAPILLLYGQDDGRHSPAAYENIPRQIIPNCARLMIEDAGHYLHLEKRDEVDPVICDFLKMRI